MKPHRQRFIQWDATSRWTLVWLVAAGWWLLLPLGWAAPICLSGAPIAATERNGAVIFWRTGTELDVLGFNVYRLDTGGAETRVNRQLLLAAVADGIGAVYRHQDTPGAVRYALGVVDLHGREWRVPCVMAAAVQRGGATPATFGLGVYQRVAHVKPSQSEPSSGISPPLPPPRRLGLGPSEKERLRISVGSEGVYRLSNEEIADGLGMTLEEARDRLATRQFRVTTGGQRIAWLPDTNDGGLLFYHPGGKTLYSRQAVFWVERGRGLVIPPLEGVAPAVTAPDSLTFSETVRFESDRIGAVFANRDPEADFWVWESLFSGEKKDAFSFVLDQKAESMAETAVVVRGVGSTYATHVADVFLNGTCVGRGSWEGKSALSITCNIPSGLLASGTNTLGLSNAVSSSSLFYLDYFDVSYRRLLKATRERLLCVGESNDVVTVRGFTNSAVRLMDVSDPRLTREHRRVRVEPDGGLYTLSFIPELGTNRYYAFSIGAIQTPLSIEACCSPGLRSATNAADYLVLTSNQLTNALRPLVEWRTRQGRMCRMIEMQEIADDFGHGVVTPQAIRAFLGHAVAHWRISPKDVLLGGKGSYDYRNNTGVAVNHVPIQLVSASSYLFASDNALADVAGDDGVPELALGRLPAVTGSEMAGMVARIIAYEQDAGGDWTHRAILTADDPDDGGDFPASMEAASAWLPPDYVRQRISLAESSVTAARRILLDAINSQAVLWIYFGHGGFNVLDGGWLGNDDVKWMTNGCRAPVLLGMTCLIARHELPGNVSLGEALTTGSNGGVAALWAPTGLSYNSAAEVLNEEFLRVRYLQKAQSLGAVVRSALAASARIGVTKDHLQVFTLLGDPGMVMR